MKTLILSIAIIFGCMLSNVTYSQSYSSYTTQSKKCGKCQKQVSNDSRSGMTCPHCGARWGRENTIYDRQESPSYQYTGYSSSSYSVVMTTSNANLRSYNSIYAPVKDVVPAYTNLTYMDYVDGWVKVKYSYYDSYYGSVTEYGWIHQSLVTVF